MFGLLAATILAQTPVCFIETSSGVQDLTEMCRQGPAPEKPEGLTIDRWGMGYERTGWVAKIVVTNPTDKVMTAIRVGYEVPRSPRSAIGSAYITRLEPGQSFEATGRHQPKSGGQVRLTSLEYLIQDENRVVRQRF